MDNFLNGFLKAWRTWRDDGREAFMRAFVQEVQQAKGSDSEHFFEILKQEMQAVGAASNAIDQQDILTISDYIDTFKKEMEQTMTQTLEQADRQQELQQDIAILKDEIQEVLTEQPNRAEQELEAADGARDAQHALLQMVQEQQQTIQAMAQEIAQLKGQHIQENALDEPQREDQEQELEQVQESSEEQELLQSIAIFQDEIQEVLTEQPNRAEQELEAEAKDLAKRNQENNSEQLSQPNPQQTPPQATEIDDKYAKLHSYFKQVELDVQQKRIKTKTDFKESFLNYAKTHMTEAELKVLLVLSQKQPSKLTQEHRNLINDALEQAHGNKHMQDLGLQLSVKAVLGHPLEAEHYTAIQNYVQQCQASLEPMDGKVADAMNRCLKTMQKTRETSQQEVGQTRETSQAQPAPHNTPIPEPWLESQNSSVHLSSATNNELNQQAQTNAQAQPVANNTPTLIPEPWLDAPKRPRGRRR
ncbi:hypothetical protein ACFOPX_03325 [Helicobacter baculiformis]|uniref:Uncharacterized protein n=1 Tax=Helicobacter baculiformis TaxID=427351 RepID=A0ABV7ZGB9_9HELI|nr:hypothetical protein [Helicobacter baculiformis]